MHIPSLSTIVSSLTPIVQTESTSDHMIRTIDTSTIGVAVEEQEETDTIGAEVEVVDLSIVHRQDMTARISEEDNHRIPVVVDEEEALTAIACRPMVMALAIVAIVKLETPIGDKSLWALMSTVCAIG
jgi:hypothetical protein